jgi:hypothetical protein
MDTKETLQRTGSHSTIIEDVEFYKYIFKKTEKVVCAVFYILHDESQIGQKDDVARDVEQTAKALLDEVLQTLSVSSAHRDREARKVQSRIIALESKLRVAHASRLLREGYLEVFLHETDSVLRALRKYIHNNDQFDPLNTSETDIFDSARTKRISRERSAIKERSVPVGLSVIPTVSRRDRIMEIIKDKGEATIKDISQSITDCSEKTVQRELIELIKDNQIVREGERRWSKYKLS